jgi:hypothetical protein
MRCLLLGFAVLFCDLGCNAKSHSSAEDVPDTSVKSADAGASASGKTTSEPHALVSASTSAHTPVAASSHAGLPTASVKVPPIASSAASQDVAQMNDSGVGPDSGVSDAASDADAGSQPEVTASAAPTSAPSAAPSTTNHNDPFELPEKCTSGQYWTQGPGDLMRPGEACNACHAQGHAGPVFAFAGTVYYRGHEPDDCNGVLPADSVVVEITDANNVKTKLQTNGAGNFTLSTSVALPYTARVLNALGERRMTTPQTSGDCNSCHTSEGKNGAPGRIAIP